MFASLRAWHAASPVRVVPPHGSSLLNIGGTNATSAVGRQFIGLAEFERGDRFDQQSVTERARPASLVSLYLLFMSLAVSARAITVASKSTRCLDAISLLAIA